jgi:nucleoside-diphosphate-sugar epimerase
VRRALVTGATGLVGSHVVERLAASGGEVRALVRDPAAAAWLARLGATLHAGDLHDAASLRRAAAGCDVVYHTAAAITGAGGWEDYRHANVDGTRTVVDAAADTGARLLHLSSVAVFGAARYSGAGGVVDESTPLAPLPKRDFYGRSKREAEALVLAAHREGRVWATAIRPCVIYGPRDRQFVPRFARLAAAGAVPLVGGGARRFAVVHAANVADAAVRAAESDAAGGQAYVTANDGDVSYEEFARLAATGLGRDARFVRLPSALASAGVGIARHAAALAGADDLAGRLGAALDFIARDNPFSSARAARELAWTPTLSHADAIPAAFRWWAEQRAAAPRGR